METGNKKIKPFEATLTIKELRFITGMKGDVVPLVRFNKKKELSKHGINAIFYNNWEEVYKLNKGAKVRFKFDENLVPTVKNVIKPSTAAFISPSNCHSCGSQLGINTKTGVYKCPNYYCSATTRGGIYRTIRQANKEVSIEFIQAFLDGYIYNHEKSSVDGFADFRIMLGQIKDKNTQGRENQWIKQHGDMGSAFWKLDVDLQNFLQSEELPTEVFWRALNFPNIKAEDFDKVRKLNPEQYLQGRERAYYSTLPDRCKKLIKVNLDSIFWMKDFFNSYGEKKWTVSEKPLEY